MKLLWASPLPPARTGVSDYAAELLQELERLVPVRVVPPPGWRPPPDWSLTAPLADPAAGPEPDELQLVHIGNNPHHEWLLPRLAQPRTAVVLHDAVVHHLLVESTLARGRRDDFARILAEACGEAGRTLVEAREVGVTGRRDPFLFPARRAVLEDAVAVVVHSRWLALQLAREVPRLPVCQVPLAVADPGPVDGAAVRAELGVAEDELLLMHLGFLTPEKGMLEILTAVAAAGRLGLPVRLLLVGEGDARRTIDAGIAALDMAGRVTTTGWVGLERLRRLPAAADLGVVLRTPSAGETSAAALRFLACGTPVAVTGLHQFLEWPVAAAPRVTPGPAAAPELVRALVAAADRGRRQARRTAAREAYLAGHRPHDAARRLIEALAPLAPQ